MATGWLGWSPQVALHTPIAQIELAIQGKTEWAKMTNPFGSSDKEQPKQDVGEQLKGAFRSMAG